MKIKLYNGDCLDIMEKLISDGISVDCVFTSPPYNSKRFKKYENFKDEYADYFNFLKIVSEKMLTLSDLVILNLQANYYNREDVYKFIGEYSKKIQRIIIWSKSNPAPSSLRHRITNSHEYFLIMTNGQTIKTNSVFTKDVVEYPVNSKRIKGHKAVMNENVCEYFISEFTKENECVLDPFLGSGTTGVVSSKLNRNFIGIEIDENYLKESKKRIEEIQIQATIF